MTPTHLNHRSPNSHAFCLHSLTYTRRPHNRAHSEANAAACGFIFSHVLQDAVRVETLPKSWPLILVQAEPLFHHKVGHGLTRIRETAEDKIKTNGLWQKASGDRMKNRNSDGKEKKCFKAQRVLTKQIQAAEGKK